MKILVFTALTEELQQKLRDALPGNDIQFSYQLNHEALNDAFQSSHIFLGNPEVALFEHDPRELQFWQLASAGFDNYKGINVNVPVANVGDLYAINCAETMMAGILALYRGINDLVLLQAKKEWNGKELRKQLHSLTGKKVLILGTGTIGNAVKRMLSGFACDVISAARKDPAAQVHAYDEVIGTLGHIDVVVNTLPGSASDYVSERFIDNMMPTSIYATVGRGTTTNEGALIKALENGNLAGAVLDVTEVEPLPTNSKLWEMPNVILTQHSGGGNSNEQDEQLKCFISNTQRFLAGEKVQDLVDLNKGY